MATIASNAFEIERRGQVFHRDINMPSGGQLGYDADPNLADPLNSDGEYLLHYCPSGTSFIQKDVTPFVKWNKVSDDPGGLWVIAGSGSGSAASYGQQFVQADLVSGYLTVIHNLAATYYVCNVTVMDEHLNQIEVDNVVFDDENTLTLDLRMLEPISSTWSVVVNTYSDGTVIIPPIINILPQHINGSSINSGQIN